MGKLTVDSGEYPGTRPLPYTESVEQLRDPGQVTPSFSTCKPGMMTPSEEALELHPPNKYSWGTT